jgi:hypothetical protein
MMNMKHLLALPLLFISFQLFAQGSIAIYKDPRIDVLLKKQAEVNNLSTRNATKRRTTKGYRLLVVSSNSRDEAIAAKTKIYTYFPELKAYMWHQSPYYKVKAGNFVSRNDALNYQKRMASFFPHGVFLLNDVIEIKPEDKDDQD